MTFGFFALSPLAMPIGLTDLNKKSRDRRTPPAKPLAHSQNRDKPT